MRRRAEAACLCFVPHPLPKYKNNSENTGYINRFGASNLKKPSERQGSYSKMMAFVLDVVYPLGER